MNSRQQDPDRKVNQLQAGGPHRQITNAFTTRISPSFHHSLRTSPSSLSQCPVCQSVGEPSWGERRCWGWRPCVSPRLSLLTRDPADRRTNQPPRTEFYGWGKEISTGHWENISSCWCTSVSYTQRLILKVSACLHLYSLAVCLLLDAPLSGEGHQVLAAFKGAAAELQGSEVKPAVLDVTEEKELAKELNATGLPAIKLYLSGDKHNPAECPGTRK